MVNPNMDQICSIVCGLGEKNSEGWLMPRTTNNKGASLVAFSLIKVNDARGDGRSLSDIWASQISFNVTLTRLLVLNNYPKALQKMLFNSADIHEKQCNAKY